MFDPSKFRDKNQIRAVSDQIHRISNRNIRLMEVCGGHTAAIHRYGLLSLLPGTISLLSGPGCPVCVSGQTMIDRAVALSQQPNVVITSYGDVIRVPGSSSSLENERGQGGDVRVVYSISEALKIARNNPLKKVVFVGIGFETSAPASAWAIKEAMEHGIKNFFLLSSHKIMPPALEALLKDGAAVDGFIAPGHVSAITGWGMYRPLVERYKIGIVVSGFEPLDIMQSILMLVRQLEEKNPSVGNQYARVVTEHGNRKALELLDNTFQYRDDDWTGLGIIPKSGLGLKPLYTSLDAEQAFPVKVISQPEPKGCLCGEILRGLKRPADCSLFGKRCTPDKPVGACMVSPEGTCSIHYHYNRDRS